MAQVRREVRFTGRVQGVGFRYSTVRVAADHDVVGFVKNLPDGRVLLVAEGQGNEVDSFVAAVRQRMEENIVDTDVRNEDYSGEFDRFGIEH